MCNSLIFRAVTNGKFKAKATAINWPTGIGHMFAKTSNLETSPSTQTLHLSAYNELMVKHFGLGNLKHKKRSVLDYPPLCMPRPFLHATISKYANSNCNVLPQALVLVAPFLSWFAHTSLEI